MKTLSVRIWDDADTESPIAGRDDVRFVVLHRRLNDPANGECGTTPAAVAAWEKRNGRSWHIVPLWLYQHGSSVYAAGESNPFSCQWDSGRVGIIAIRKRDYKPAGRAAAVDSICATYTDWANGECYGFDIVDDEGETVDSCGGFIGREECEAAAQEALANLQEVRPLEHA